MNSSAEEVENKGPCEKNPGKLFSQGLCDMNWVPTQHPFMISSLMPMGVTDLTLDLVCLGCSKPKEKVVLESGVFY